MDTQIAFSVLGPLDVRRGGTAVAIPPAKQRVVLATLLMNSNRMVSVDDLAEAVWNADPPRSARVTLQNYVKRLRARLADASHSRIETRPGGYLIRIAPDELDALRFEALQRSAALASRSGLWDKAADDLRAALSLWRGEPLADVPSDLLALREVPRLSEMRLQAVEALVEADLNLGQHARVIAELRKLTAVHPLRERLHVLLMLALYRDGQQAAALDAYRQARAVLVRELGAEPGQELRQIEHHILTSDPSLARKLSQGGPDAQPESREMNCAAAVPRQLPPAVRHFTGRLREIAALTRMVSTEAGHSRAVVITAIGGMAGVGKTALAVHWAHHVADKFPDGQLYTNLRGYDPGPPVRAEDALAGFLRALGAVGTDIPSDLEERTALYRTMMAGRRVLVLLDNANAAEQVRPLLPAAPGCVAVVTSRDALPGLVARDGAARLELDPLPLVDAIEVLRSQIGARVVADMAAAETLAMQCSLLPLALRVAGELSAARPNVPLASLVTELADERHRLDLLDATGDARTAIRAVFSWSCQHLEPDAVRTFGLLGLPPGPDYDTDSVAALTGRAPADAGAQLEQLSRAHLIQPSSPGRYGMHDLLRAYARELAHACCSQDEVRAALTRLFDHYLRYAIAATETAFPTGRPQQLPEAASTEAPLLADETSARSWLGAHRAALLAAVTFGADGEWPSYASRLGPALFRYLEAGGFYPELLTMYGDVRRAAQRSGDIAAEAEAINNICIVDLRQGRYDEATAHLQLALDLYHRNDDQAGHTRVLGNLGIVSFLQGHYSQAVQYQRQALNLYLKLADKAGESRTLTNLGLVDLRQGRYEQAAIRFTAALTWFRQIRDRGSEAYAQANLGVTELRMGQHQHANARLEEALATFREVGNPSGEAYALSSLGTSELLQHNLDRAAAYLLSALELSRQTGDRAEEAGALNTLGQVLLHTGKLSEAHDLHASALDIARQIGDRYEQARAHQGIAHCLWAAGDAQPARERWRSSLALHDALGTPEADQIRVQLAAASADCGPPVAQEGVAS